MDSTAILSDAGALGAVPSRAISGLTADSRKVKAGFAFFAVPGTQADGLSFAPKAAAAGAALIVSEATAAPESIDGVPVVRVANVRQALSKAAAAFYPRQPGVIAAVTGTSGKTSVAAFVRQNFLFAGHPAASIGTIGLVKPSGETYGSLTTPDPITLHETLQSLADEGVSHCAFEASSHGLDQHRLDGVRIQAAGFTNLSRDHLDYHPDFDAYRAAKLRLVNDLLPADGVMVAPDDAEGQHFLAAAKARGISTIAIGRGAKGIDVTDIAIDGAAQVITLAFAGRHYRTRVPLLGQFQADNALLAAGLAIGCGVAPETAFAALEKLEGAKGRLDFVGSVNGAPVVVDYAHKPGALETVLDAVRPFAKGRVIVIVGCGGDRDPGKRPMMGRIAVSKADVAIITDDNPRSEDPAKIRAAILADAPGAREIGDRAEAIRAGVAMLKAGDLLVIAGKGHENGQIVGQTVLPFSDHDVARAAIEEFST